MTIEPSEILKAVQELRTELRADVSSMKGELSGQFHTGITAVNLALASLTEAHHRAVIEQEKRNAEFAQRTRLDELISQVHGHSGKLTSATLRIDINDKHLDKLDTCITELTETVETNLTNANARFDGATISMLKGTLGYILLTAITILGAIAGFAASHFLK